MWPFGKGFLGGGHSRDSASAPDLAALAETIGKSISAAAVFGHPVHRGRTTVIPVAKARYGLGGGRMPWSKGGSGAGGSMKVSPAGYLLLRGARARYQPIGDRSWSSAGLAFGLLAVLGALLAFLISAGGLRRD